MVKIMFLGPLSEYAPEEDEQGYWVVDGANKSIDEILKNTNIKESKMGYSVIVNEMKESTDYILKDGDVVSVLPLFFAG